MTNFGRRVKWLLAVLLAGFPMTEAANAQTAGQRNVFGTYQQGQHYVAVMPPHALLVQQFTRVALESESGGQDRRGRIVKWTGPIRVRMEGDPSPAVRDEVMGMLRWITRLTGIPFVERSWLSAKDANLTIQFFQGPSGKIPNNTNVCSAQLWHRDFIASRASVRIMVNKKAIRRHCITEELSQIMGLMNDSDFLYPSIFNDSGNDQGLHGWDELMLRVLYDHRVTPGMRKREAVLTARHVIGEILLREGIRTEPPKKSVRRSTN